MENTTREQKIKNYLKRLDTNMKEDKIKILTILNHILYKEIEKKSFESENESVKIQMLYVLISNVENLDHVLNEIEETIKEIRNKL
jgi:hypothetical protein